MKPAPTFKQTSTSCRIKKGVRRSTKRKKKKKKKKAWLTKKKQFRFLAPGGKSSRNGQLGRDEGGTSPHAGEGKVNAAFSSTPKAIPREKGHPAIGGKSCHGDWEKEGKFYSRETSQNAPPLAKGASRRFAKKEGKFVGSHRSNEQASGGAIRHHGGRKRQQPLTKTPRKNDPRGVSVQEKKKGEDLLVKKKRGPKLRYRREGSTLGMQRGCPWLFNIWKQ